MKKSILLIVILMFSHKSISQTVTLSSNQAKAVIKDLVKGDYCQEENKNLLEQNAILLSQVEAKSDEVENLEAQNESMQSVVFLKDNIIESQKKIISDNEKIIKRKENTSLIYKIGTGVAIVLGIIVALQ